MERRRGEERRREGIREGGRVKGEVKRRSTLSRAAQGYTLYTVPLNCPSTQPLPLKGWVGLHLALT